MRIISGIYKGRNIIGYDIDGTRPTMDRVKESFFAMIQNDIKNSVCLDLFAGSGALGLEALSNYASTCYFVDKNKKALDTLKKNIDNLKLDNNYRTYNLDFKEALSKLNLEKTKFDIIFLDPPYQENLITPSLELIDKYDLLSEDGLIICEYEGEAIKYSPYVIYKERSYGSKNVTIYKKAQ